MVGIVTRRQPRKAAFGITRPREPTDIVALLQGSLPLRNSQQQYDYWVSISIGLGVVPRPTAEPKIRNLNPGILEPWNPGTLEPWILGSLELWNPKTLESLEPWNFGALAVGMFEKC